MKARRHHNNDGRRQIANGSTRKQVAGIAKRLGVPVKTVWYNDPDVPQWVEAEVVDGWLIETGRTRPFEAGDDADLPDK